MKSRKRNLKLSLALSAGILASVVSTHTTQEVQAQEASTVDQVKALHTEYKDVQAKNEQSKERLSELKVRLIDLIKESGGTPILEQINVQELSEAELEHVFQTFFEYLETQSSDEVLDDAVVIEESEEVADNSEDQLEDAAEEVIAEEVILEETAPETKATEQEVIAVANKAVAKESTPTVKVPEKAVLTEKADEATHTQEAVKLAKVDETVNAGEHSNVVVTPKTEAVQLPKQVSDNVKTPEVAPTPSVTLEAKSADATPASATEAKIDKGQRLTQDQFIDLIGREAQRLVAEYNIYGSVMMAQAALQSGWGQSATSQDPNNNVMGITAGATEQGVEFRVYESAIASLRDYAELIRNGVGWDRHFYSGAWRENAKTYEEATKWLTGRYAIDPNYHHKLNALIKQYNLTRFDVKVSGMMATKSPMTTKLSHVTNTSTHKVKPVVEPTETAKKVEPAQETGETPSTPNVSSTENTYTVQSGDSLSSVATKLNASISQVIEANKPLETGALKVGQEVKVPVKEEVAPAPKIELPKPAAQPAAPVVPTPVASTQAWVRPTAGIVTSRYGDRAYPLDPSRRDFHTGIDISSGTGSPIVAAKAGTIVRSQTSGYNGGYGNFIEIDHGNGLSTLYAHLAPVGQAAVGQKVSAGERIATQGTTGASTGIHLHFEIRQNGAHTNPENHMQF